MNLEVKIPPMGESITSGILAKWRIKDGDVVSAGTILFELETDKITSEGTAESGGKITLKSKEGDEVRIGQVVASIDTSAQASTPEVSTQTAPETNTSTPKKTDTLTSPAVRRIAQESSIDVSSVSGSGKDGRVTKADMLTASTQNKAACTPASSSNTISQTCIDAEDKTQRRKLTPLRKRIAERLVASQQTTASLTTFNEVDMSAIMALRAKHQEGFVAKYGMKLGFMSFFVKAVVHALKEVPAINAQLDGDELIQNYFYDIGVAVGTDRGLVVPVVRDCDKLDFEEKEKSISSYAKKARDGKISMEDLQGGVFTITNGGIYGSLLSTPILNSPQSAILGMHSIQERAVVINGQIVVRPMMNLALTYDHQVVDGKEAVTCLVKIKQSIEDPTRLLLSV